jgi:hypothetical protein
MFVVDVNSLLLKREVGISLLNALRAVCQVSSTGNDLNKSISDNTEASCASQE